MKMILIMLLAVIFTAGSLFCKAGLRLRGIYSDQFFSYGSFAYNEGNILFVKHQHSLNYTARDTIMFEYSTDMRKMDTVSVYHPAPSSALELISVNDHFYYFFTRKSSISVNKHDGNIKISSPILSVSGDIIQDKKKLYMINARPTSFDTEHFWIQEAFAMENEEIKGVQSTPLRLPPVTGFSMMHVQPREAMAVVGDTIVLADPCLEKIYYYDFQANLLNSFRIDSLLGVTGSCEKFKTFRQDKEVPQRNFDQLMDMNTEGGILRSVNNYKGKLLVRVTTGYSDCDTYIIDPASLKWEKLSFGNMPGTFGAENIPLNNFTVIDGNYLINTIWSNIKDLDLSRFSDYKEFVRYTEEAQNTGTSYLVREIIFE